MNKTLTLTERQMSLLAELIAEERREIRDALAFEDQEAERQALIEEYNELSDMFGLVHKL